MNLQWIILAEIDLIEAEQPIIYLRNILLIVIAITSAITFLITFFLSKRISNPIIKLTNAVSNFSKGDFKKLEIPTKDEIEILADTFNDMAEHLQQKEKELTYEKSLRLKEVIDKLDSERERLSRELHDGIGQSFIAMKLKMENCEFDSMENSKELVEDLKDNLNSIIDEIRSISNDLMPAVLYEFGLETAIRNICNKLSEFTNIEIKVNIRLGALELEKSAKIYIFRIIQEALNNAIKHSSATEIQFNILYNNQQLKIEIVDNGNGFHLNDFENGIGNGLHNMKERVNLLNGKFTIESEVEKGTIISAEFELKNGTNKNYIS
jgi:signal transduction histidine kinase